MAGIGNRILACLIDMLITYVAVGLVVALSLGILWVLESLRLPGRQSTMLNIYVISTAVIGIFVILLGYFIYFESLWQGQTPGKRLMRIRVVDENGAPCSLSSVWIRNLVRNVDIGVGLIGLLFIVFDKKERRLGDFAGGTLVIRERRMEDMSVEVMCPESHSLTQHIDAGRITPEEYQIVSSFLSRRVKLNRAARQLLANQLREYLLPKVSAGQLNQERPEAFLEAVYFAYQKRAT